MDREKITFAQAEGAEPLPTPLRAKEVSQELRAKLWMVIRSSMLRNRQPGDEIFREPSRLFGDWLEILLDWFVNREHRMIDEFSTVFDVHERNV